MAAKQWCMFISESAFKSPVAPTGGNLDTAWVPLDLPDDDAVAIRRQPNVEQLATAKARGGPDRVVGDTYAINGSAKGILYPNQAPLIAGWGLVLVDQSGTPDYPWTTTEADGDLASATFALAYEDWTYGNVTKRRYRGCKAQQFTLEAARGTRGGVVQWSADVVGSDQASSTDTEPTLDQYPTLAAYHLSDASLLINNVAITNFEGFRLQASNTFEVAFDESTTANVIRLQSRTITLQIPGAALKATPDWEALYTGQTLMATTKLTLTHPANNHRITLDLQGAARMSEWQRNLRLQNRHNQTCTITAQLDRTTAADFTCTFDDPTP